MTKRHDERGAILVLSIVGMVLAMIFSAMAVDLGFTAQEARRNQKVADLAALDAVRDLANHQSVAATSAHVRNELPSTPGFLVESCRGTFDGTAFVPSGDCNSGEDVQVTVTSPHRDLFPFVAGADQVVRRAVATLEEKASFDLGSKLASLNPSDSTVLNQVFSAILGTSPDLNLDLVSYRGLAAGTVSIGELVAADPSLGTANELMTGTVSLQQLATASLAALENRAAGGDLVAAEAATALGTFATNIPADLHVNMGDILVVNAPDDPSAASAEIGVFNLLTTGGQAAQIANGDNFLNVPNLDAGIPGVANTNLRMHLIETPRIALPGPVRQILDDPVNYPTGWQTWAQTAQIDIELTTTVGSCGFLLPTCLEVTLNVDGAKAFGSLTDITCSSGNKFNDILVETVAGQADADLNVEGTVAGLALPPLLGASVALGGGSETLTFQNNPTDPEYPTPVQSVSPQGLNLANTLTSDLSLLGLPIGDLLSVLNPVANAIDAQVLTPVFESLGLAVGGADVRTLSVECGIPVLID